MSKRKKVSRLGDSFGITRRSILKTAVSGAALLAAPALMSGPARAAGQYMDLGSLQGAKIDWRQAEGANITIGVIPAG